MPNVIVATDPQGIIGVDGRIPWHYREDFRRFKRVTMGGALIMGRLTFESLPKAKKGKTVLPGRTIITMTSRIDNGTRLASGGVVHVGSFRAALQATSSTPPSKVWFAGGERVYREAIEGGHVREIDLTLVPPVTDVPPNARVARFPQELLRDFDLVSEDINPEDARLIHRLYRCRRSPRLD